VYNITNLHTIYSIERKMTDKKFYVKNEDLLPHIHEYRETGIVSEELGRMLMMIADNFANKGSFHNYTWKEDMKQEAIITCLRYIHNFNPLRYSRPNPFAYFTTIIRNSFLNYIRKQKQHSKIKDECFNNYHLLRDEEKNGFNCVKGIDYTVLKEKPPKKKKKKKKNEPKS